MNKLMIGAALPAVLAAAPAAAQSGADAAMADMRATAARLQATTKGATAEEMKTAFAHARTPCPHGDGCVDERGSCRKCGDAGGRAEAAGSCEGAAQAHCADCGNCPDPA